MAFGFAFGSRITSRAAEANSSPLFSGLHLNGREDFPLCSFVCNMNYSHLKSESGLSPHTQFIKFRTPNLSTAEV